MPTFSYTNPADWIMEFEKESVIKMDIDTILNVLENPSQEDFYNNNYEETTELLFVNAKTIPYNLIQVEELDLPALNKLWNRYLYEKCTHIDADGNSLIPSSQIMFYYNKEEDQYEVTFGFFDKNQNDYNYEYVGNEDVVKKLLRVLLASGAVFYNENEINVKLQYNTNK